MSISSDDVVSAIGYIRNIIPSGIPHSKSEFFYEKSIVEAYPKSCTSETCIYCASKDDDHRYFGYLFEARS